MWPKLKRLLSPIALLSATALLTAAGPLPKDIIELQGSVFGRSDSKFRDTDQNKTIVLGVGTKAIVDDVKQLPSGNYGLCLRIISVDSGKACHWVYHDPKRPNMKFYEFKNPEDREQNLKAWTSTPRSVTTPTANSQPAAKTTPAKSPTAAPLAVQNPAPGVAAQVTRPVQSLTAPAKPLASPPAAAPAGDQRKDRSSSVAPAPTNGTESLNRAVAEKVGQVSSGLNKSMPSSTDCEKCTASVISKEEVCVEKKNDYLQKEILDLSQSPKSIVAQLLNVNQGSKYIKEECFSNVMLSSGGPFKTCLNGKARLVPRACLTKELSKITQASFDLTIDCLGEFLTNDPKTVSSAAKDFFFLGAHESGQNLNAVSVSGAGGTMQLTDPAGGGVISYVNRVEKSLMKNFLSEKKDPRCAPVQQALDQGMGEGWKNSCDRTSLAKGNPLLNLVYGLAYQKYLRQNIRSYFTENPLYKGPNRIFSKLPEDAKEYLDSQLSIWSHNTGDGAMRSALRSYLSTRLNKPMTSLSDAKKMLQELKSYVEATVKESNASGKGQRNLAEPTNFWSTIQRQQALFEKNAGGGSCSVQAK